MPHYVYISIKDEKGDISTVSFPFPDSTSVTDLVLLPAAIWALIDPLVTGGLAEAGFRYVANVAATAASAGSDVQEKGEFVLRTVNGFLKRLNLPTFIESFFHSGSKEIDQAAGDVAAFITLLEDGIDLTGSGGSGIVQPCDVRGEDLVSLEAAIENWGKRRS